MYREQFTPWKPGAKVLMLDSKDASVIYAMSHGKPHFGKSESEFLTKLYESSTMANRAIIRAIMET